MPQLYIPRYERRDSIRTKKFKILGTCTVKELIQLILEQCPKEWGYIGIAKEDNFFGDPKCIFDRGKIETPLPEEILNQTATELKIDGCWSWLNYNITI